MLNKVKENFQANNHVAGFRIVPLFKTRDKEIDTLAENQVFVVELPNGPNSGRLKELTTWLGSGQDLSAFFISNEIKGAYHQGTVVGDILEIRKQQIIAAEKLFVESLDMIYEEV
jgi:hypothetical protein